MRCFVEMNEYQIKMDVFRKYPNKGKNLTYPTLGLTSEAGEVAGAVKKLERDHNNTITPEIRENLILEGGDVLWYLAALASELGTTLEEMAQKNLDKLAGRLQRGTIQGNGDHR